VAKGDLLGVIVKFLLFQLLLWYVAKPVRARRTTVLVGALPHLPPVAVARLGGGGK
jgi:hypothetical protein